MYKNVCVCFPQVIKPAFPRNDLTYHIHSTQLSNWAKYTYFSRLPSTNES